MLPDHQQCFQDHHASQYQKQDTPLKLNTRTNQLPRKSSHHLDLHAYQSSTTTGTTQHLRSPNQKHNRQSTAFQDHQRKPFQSNLHKSNQHLSPDHHSYQHHQHTTDGSTSQGHQHPPTAAEIHLFKTIDSNFKTNTYEQLQIPPELTIFKTIHSSIQQPTTTTTSQDHHTNTRISLQDHTNSINRH